MGIERPEDRINPSHEEELESGTEFERAVQHIINSPDYPPTEKRARITNLTHIQNLESHKSGEVDLTGKKPRRTIEIKIKKPRRIRVIHLH